MNEDEVRIIDPDTGGEKGSKPTQLLPLLEMCPEAFLTDLGKVYAMGASKYSVHNWRRGYAWSLSLNALLRHVTAVAKGEWLDPESGFPHIVHVAWHCATLHTFEKEGLGHDDRTNSGAFSGGGSIPNSDEVGTSAYEPEAADNNDHRAPTLHDLTSTPIYPHYYNGYSNYSDRLPYRGDR